MPRLNIRLRPRVFQYDRASFHHRTILNWERFTWTTIPGKRAKNTTWKRSRTKEDSASVPSFTFSTWTRPNSTSRYVPSHNSRQAGIKDSLPGVESSMPAAKTRTLTIHWISHTRRVDFFFSERSLRVRRPDASRETRGVYLLGVASRYLQRSPRRREISSWTRHEESPPHVRDTLFQMKLWRRSDLRRSPAR